MIRSARSLAAPIGVALAGLAVVVAVLMVVSPPSSGGVATPLPQESGDEADTDTAATLAALDVTRYEVFLSRDPFEPLRPNVVPAPTTTATPGVTPTATPTPGTTPTPGATPTPTPTAPDGCQQGAQVVCSGRTVALIDVFEDAQGSGAVVQVDSTLYTVRDGEIFAGSFLVESIEPPCVTLLFGDDRFTLCEGEAVLK